MTDQKNISASQAISIGWNFLKPAERKATFALSFLQLIVRTADIVALAGIVPLVSLIMDPQSDTSQKALKISTQFISNISISEIIVSSGIVVILLLLFSTVGTIYAQYLTSLHASKTQARFTNDVVKQIMSAPIAWSLTRNSALLVRILANDFSVWSRGFVEGAINAVGNLATILLSIVLVIIGTSWSGLLALVLFALLSASIFLYVKPMIKKASSSQRSTINNLAMLLTQSLNGIRDIKISSREQYFLDACNDHVHRMAQARVQTTLWYSIPPAALIFIGQIGILMIAFSLWYFGASTSDITTQITLLLLVTTRVVPAFSRLGTGSSRLWDVFPYLQGIDEVVTSLTAATAHLAEARNGKAVPDLWEDIRFHNVSFKYEQSKTHSLSAINVTIEHNKAYGIVGPSGAGKSTFIDLILRLYEPTSGRITIAQQEMSEINLQSWHRRIGYVPQQSYIADATVRENVAFGVADDEIDDAKVISSLKAVRLDDLLERLDDGINSKIGENGLLVSGGQRQRIAIARALYNAPQILILDEATSALDTITELAIQKFIREISHKMTIITIAHRLQTVRQSDSIIVFNDGQIDAVGSYDELLQTNPLFQELVSYPSLETPTLTPKP